jgi:hypothetical protein
MRVVTIAAALACLLGACHLADEDEQGQCTPGTRLERGRCVDADTPTGPVVRIGAACALDPALLRVAAGAPFRFQNDDVVDHEIRGGDGQTWARLPAGQSGPDQTIARVGAWPYSVVGCANVAQIVVE